MCPPNDLTLSIEHSAEPHFDIKAIIPQTPISFSAYEHASSLLQAAIFNHSLRVYLYAKALAQHSSSVYFTDSAKHDLLFTACILHDIGTTDKYNGSHRFEVEGADAAKTHLSQFGVSEADAHDVWTAIAIHTSPGIAERIGELSKLVRLAVVMDFGWVAQEWKTVLEPLKEKLEESLGRQDIEKVLGDSVVEQAKERPEKAPMVSWPGVMYRAWLAEPGWKGVNKGF